MAALRPLARPALLAALLAAAAAGDVAAQGARAPVNVQFDRLSVQDGLSTTTVAALLQDRTGFLWVGTELGLDRYDGYGFTSFRHDPDDTASLSSSFATALEEGPGGTLWVGTYGGGLNRLDPATGRARRVRHRPGDRGSLSDDRVEALRVDRRGRLWAGTGVGLDLVGPLGRVRRFGAALRRAAGAPGGVYVRDLALAPNGDLWVGSLAGLFRFDTRRGRVRLHVGAAALGSPAVLAVHVDRDGTVWAGTDGGGLARVDPRTGAVTRLRHDPADAGSLCGDAVHDVTRDRAGILWVASNGGGVCRLDATGTGQVRARPARFVAYRSDDGDPHSVSTDGTRVLLPDRGGLVWVGTWGGGLNKLRRTPFELFRATPADGFASPDVMAFAEAPGGRMWVGTYDAGLVLVDADGRSVPVPGLPAVLADGGVRSLVVDRSGALWATSDDTGGLWRRSPSGRWGRVLYPEGAGVRRTTDLQLGPDGTVWVSAYGPGLCRADPDRLRIDCPATRFPRGRRLSGTEAYAVYPDADGTVWVSLWGVGLDRVDPARGRLAHFANDADRAGSLSQNNVTAFARDRLGRLWIGTYGGGLNRYEPGPPGGPPGGGRFHHVGVDDGMPDGAAYAIVPDGAGQLWVTTNRGIARFDPVREDAEAFGVEDGLQSDEFNSGAALRLADGRLVVGGIRGYNRFDPRHVRATGPPPPVAVTALRVLGAPRGLPAGRLTLGHDETAVAFELAALDFTAPARNLFAYRLDGLDDEWTKAGARREAAYTNLAPGHYTLRVRAASSGGVWNEAGLAVPFEVRPAWWQTWPFRGAVGLGLLAALVLAVRYASQRRLLAEVARLDAARRIQDERGRISRDLHDSVGAQLSSLLAGVDLVRLARRRARGSAAAADEALAGVEADARETMAQLRESIWALHESSVTLGALRDRLDADVRHRLRGRAAPAATVALDAPAETALGPEQALHLYRIAREAVTNSLKHADAGRLDVRIGMDAGALVVEVRDDGRFRPPGGDPGGDGAADGTAVGAGAGISGFGIDSMRTRAAALGARLDVETDGGTTVRVTVPAGPPA